MGCCEHGVLVAALEKEAVALHHRPLSTAPMVLGQSPESFQMVGFLPTIVRTCAYRKGPQQLKRAAIEAHARKRLQRRRRRGPGQYCIVTARLQEFYRGDSLWSPVSACSKYFLD